jgi:hypothetical protein
MASNIEARAERLLSALAGVVSARALADEFGRLCEIHVLASPELHPKQIVRNVESALSAGLGVVVDRRIVSVAQLRANAAEPYISPSKTSAAATADELLDRMVYVKFDASSTSALDATCTVTLGRGSERIVGSSTGMNTVQGRADTAARAVFNAFQENREGLDLEGTAVVEAQGKTFVFVSARSVTGRVTRLLTGVCALKNSPEEAGIMAALQATNRMPAV